MNTVSDIAGLFAAHRNGVFRYLWRVVGHADSARDLTQEVFLRAARAGAPPPQPDEGRAWVFKIARNLALNHVRDRVRREQATGPVASAQPPTQDVAVAVREALAALTPLDRDVFVLRESVGLGYDEIARACDLSPDAVRSRLHRTRQQLREILSRALDDERTRGVRLRERDTT